MLANKVGMHGSPVIKHAPGTRQSNEWKAVVAPVFERAFGYGYPLEKARFVNNADVMRGNWSVVVE